VGPDSNGTRGWTRLDVVTPPSTERRYARLGPALILPGSKRRAPQHLVDCLVEIGGRLALKAKRGLMRATTNA
jgi:hypothetical protein